MPKVNGGRGLGGREDIGQGPPGGTGRLPEVGGIGGGPGSETRPEKKKGSEVEGTAAIASVFSLSLLKSYVNQTDVRNQFYQINPSGSPFPEESEKVKL